MLLLVPFRVLSRHLLENSSSLGLPFFSHCILSICNFTFWF